MSEQAPSPDTAGEHGTAGHELLAELADDFARRYRQGERPSVEAYAQEHPAMADQIRELFPAMLAMEQSGLAPTIEIAHVDRVGTTIARYTLLERIGEGGFGTVFLAEQQHPVRRQVALKIIKAGMDSRQVIARFQAERQALAIMDHPNIAKVLDAGETDAGRPYFVMELVKGIPITDYCDQARLSTRQRLELFVQVCHAVQHAHQKGIIHRDLKPSNVLVTLHDDKPVPKVIDFGVAKAGGLQLTERTLFTGVAQMVGTPLYMSPEQAQMGGVDVDTRSDVYSLGVLLYELLTGTTPFDRQRLGKAAFDEVRRIIREEDPPNPSTRLSTMGDAIASVSALRHTEPKKLSQTVRGELDWIVMKAMEKERARRYETANGLARDVERHLCDEPVAACPPSAAYRFRKFARRNKAPLAMAGVVFAALLLTMIGLAVSNVLVRAERNEKVAALGQKVIALGEKQAALGAKEAALAEAKANYAKARRRYYAAQMNLATQAWEEKHPARVLQLLESQRPRFDQDDLRGFDWYYLWRLCQGSYRFSLPTLNFDNATAIAISPDGETLASVYGTTVRLWEVTTGREIGELPSHAHMISGLAFAPDGKTLAAADESDIVKLWDLATRTTRATVRPGQGVACVQFTGDGRTLVLSGKRVKLWDVAANEEVATLGESDDYFVFVAAAPAGDVVAASANDIVRIWIRDGGAWREAPPLYGAGYYPRVAISGDGKLLAVGLGTQSNGTPTLYDLPSRRERMTLQGHTGPAFAIDFTADGKRLASGGMDRTVRIWDVASGRQEACLAQPGPVYGLALTPDGAAVAALCTDAIRVWGVAPPAPASVLHHLTPVDSVAFSPDGKILAARGRNETKLWDVAGDRTISTLATETPNRWLRGIAFAPDGTSLAIPRGNAVDVWSVSGGRLAVLSCEAFVYAVAYSPDGKSLAAATRSGIVEVWDVHSKQRRYSTPAVNWGVAVAFSPDGKMIAAGYQFGVVKLFDAASGRELSTLQRFELAIDFAYCVAFSPDSRELATGNRLGLVRIWDIATGRLDASLIGHTNAVTSLAFLDRGRTLASGSEDRTVRLWDVETGQERIALRGHTGAVSGVAFAAKGSVLATSSQDGTVRLWRAATDEHARAPEGEMQSEGGQSPVADNEFGDRLWQACRTAEAESTYRRALARLEKLLAAFPDDAAYRGETIRSLLSISLLLRVERGDIPDAEATRLRAVEIYQKLKPQEQRALLLVFSERQRKLNGSDAVQQGDRTLCQMIDLLPQDDAGWMTRAAQHLAACSDPKLRNPAWAVELGRRATTLPTTDQNQLAGAWAYLGVALEGAGRRAEAEEPYRKATALWKQLSDQEPGNEWYRHERAYFSLALANVLQAAGRSQAAVNPCRLGVQLNERLAADFPANPDHAERLGQARSMLIGLLRSLGRDEEAAQVAREQEKFAASQPALREADRRQEPAPQTPEDRGWTLLREGKFSDAQAAFAEHLRLYPDHGPAHRGLANSLQKQNKPAEAIASLREAIRLDPSDFWAHENLGRALLDRQEPAVAETAFREAIRVQPALVSAYVGLGTALREQKKSAESLAPLREAVRLDPGNHQAHHQLSWSLLEVKQFAQAEVAFREAVRLKPEIPSSHFGLGSVLIEQKKFAEAEIALREGLRLEPAQPWAARLLGRALIGQGKLAEAKAEGLVQASDLASAYYEHAEVLHQQKKLAEAEATLREAIRLEPAHSLAHGGLGWVLIDQQKFSEAEAEFRQAIRLAPERPAVHRGLGMALDAQNKPAEAIACFREATRLDGNDFQAHGALGWALLKQQHPAEAEAEFTECVRLQPDRAEGYWGLGRARFDQKKFAAAETALRDAIRLEPTHPWARSLLVQALVKQGKQSEADELSKRELKTPASDLKGADEQNVGRH